MKVRKVCDYHGACPPLPVALAHAVISPALGYTETQLRQALFTGSDVKSRSGKRLFSGRGRLHGSVGRSAWRHFGDVGRGDIAEPAEDHPISIYDQAVKLRFLGVAGCLGCTAAERSEADVAPADEVLAAFAVPRQNGFIVADRNGVSFDSEFWAKRGSTVWREESLGNCAGQTAQGRNRFGHLLVNFHVERCQVPPVTQCNVRLVRPEPRPNMDRVFLAEIGQIFQRDLHETGQ